MKIAKKYQYLVKKILDSINYEKMNASLFSIVLISAGIFFSVNVPLLWGYDETAHFARSYQISEGGWTSSKTESGVYGGSLPANFVNLANKSIDDRNDIHRDNKTLSGLRYVSDLSLYTDYANAPFSGERVDYNFPGAAAYSPVAYAVPATTIAITRPIDLSMRHTIILARVALLLVYAFIVVLAFNILRDNTAKYLVAAVSLLPSAVFQAATIGTDGLVIGLSLLIFALFIRATSQGYKLNKKHYLLMLGVAVILPLVKINYIFLSFLVLFIKPSFKLRSSRHLAIERVATAAIIITPVLVWNIIVKNVASGITQKSGVNPIEQLMEVLANPFSMVTVLARSFVENEHIYITGLIGRAGWGGIIFPTTVLIAAAFLLCIATLYSKTIKKQKKERVMHARASYLLIFQGLLTGIGVFLTLYLTFTAVGNSTVEGVHGRYLIPVVPFVLYGVAQFLPISTKDLSPKATSLLFFSCFAAIYIYSSIWYRLIIY